MVKGRTDDLVPTCTSVERGHWNRVGGTGLGPRKIGSEIIPISSRLGPDQETVNGPTEPFLPSLVPDE